MAAASPAAPGWRERLRRFWIKSVASGRYDRLDGTLRVARKEIERRICERERVSSPSPEDQGRRPVGPTGPTDPVGPISRTDEACWASTATTLLTEAQAALDRCEIDQGWRLLHAARRAELLALDEDELEHRATVLRAEADKLRSWRQKAVQRLLGTPENPEASVCRAAVVEAANLRDEHYDNQAYKDDLLRTQMLVLVLCLFVVMVPLLYVLTSPGAGQGAEASRATETAPASFPVIALFGVLGATISGMLRATDSGQATRIPELTAAMRVTFMRILMGSASAVIIQVFLRSPLGDFLGQSLFSDAIARAVEELQPYTAYAIAFVAGFSERWVLRAVEAVAGKSDDRSKAGGASS